MHKQQVVGLASAAAWSSRRDGPRQQGCVLALGWRFSDSCTDSGVCSGLLVLGGCTGWPCIARQSGRTESAAGLKERLHCACARVKFRACSCEAAPMYRRRRRHTFLFTGGRIYGSARARLAVPVSEAAVLPCLRIYTHLRLACTVVVLLQQGTVSLVLITAAVGHRSRLYTGSVGGVNSF
jgi:hypothetical protein